MKKLLATIFCAGLTALLSSCGTARDAATLNAALDGRWSITRVGDMTVKAGDSEKEAFMAFEANTKHLSGCAGCNRIFGSYTTGDKAGTISFGDIASTKMMCADMKLEDNVLNAMGKVEAFKVKGNSLKLLDSKGKTLIELTKKQK